MIEKFYNTMLHQRSIKSISLSEMSEIYISMILRGIAFGIVGIFVPFYLYDVGLGFSGVVLFYGAFFATRSITDILFAFVIARIGPKHSMVLSYLLQVFASYALFAIESQGWNIAIPAITWGAGNSLFYLALHVDFSKVKHTKKGGSEYGFLEIMQRFGMALGPFAGGLIAAVFGPENIFLIAALIMLAGTVPLLMTPEPVKTHQKISFNKLPIQRMWRIIFSNTCATAENNLRGITWPLFISLFALGDAVYVKLGAISTVGLIISVFAAFVVGKLVDMNKGRLVLNIAAYSTAAIHLIRPFINTVTGSLLVFIGGDVATTAHHIPYHKGLYDKVEEFPGSRITFMSLLEAVSSVFKLLVWVVVALATFYTDTRSILVGCFMFCAVLSVGITAQRFKL